MFNLSMSLATCYVMQAPQPLAHIFLQCLLYYTGQPLSTWRLTPTATGGLSSSWSPEGPDSFPTPEVTSRYPSEAALQALRSERARRFQREGEQLLSPAYEWMLSAFEAE